MRAILAAAVLPAFALEHAAIRQLVAEGTHGYDPNQPGLHGAVAACGAGIAPGSRLGTMNDTNVALLGIQMRDADGRVLDGILKK